MSDDLRFCTSCTPAELLAEIERLRAELAAAQKQRDEANVAFIEARGAWSVADDDRNKSLAEIDRLRAELQAQAVGTQSVWADMDQERRENDRLRAALAFREEQICSLTGHRAEIDRLRAELASALADVETERQWGMKAEAAIARVQRLALDYNRAPVRAVPTYEILDALDGAE